MAGVDQPSDVVHLTVQVNGQDVDMVEIPSTMREERRIDIAQELPKTLEALNGRVIRHYVVDETFVNIVSR